MKRMFLFLACVMSMVFAGCNQRSYNSDTAAIESSLDGRIIPSFKEENGTMFICLSFQATPPSRPNLLFPNWTRIDKFRTRAQLIDVENQKRKINHRSKPQGACDGLNFLGKFVCNLTNPAAKDALDKEATLRSIASAIRVDSDLKKDINNGEGDVRTEKETFQLMLDTAHYFSANPNQSGSMNACPRPQPL